MECCRCWLTKKGDCTPMSHLWWFFCNKIKISIASQTYHSNLGHTSGHVTSWFQWYEYIHPNPGCHCTETVWKKVESILVVTVICWVGGKSNAWQVNSYMPVLNNRCASQQAATDGALQLQGEDVFVAFFVATTLTKNMSSWIFKEKGCVFVWKLMIFSNQNLSFLLLIIPRWVGFQVLHFKPFVVFWERPFRSKLLGNWVTVLAIQPRKTVSMCWLPSKLLVCCHPSQHIIYFGPLGHFGKILNRHEVMIKKVRTITRVSVLCSSDASDANANQHIHCREFMVKPPSNACDSHCCIICCSVVSI